MTQVELMQWVANLKSGDRVAVFEHYGRVFWREAKVARRTPSGRVVLESGSTFKPDSYLHGNAVYRHRCIRPPLV